jgi:hypothetical protein
MNRLRLGRTALILFIAGAILLPLGMVGQEDGGLWPDGPSWIGAIGWFGFLLCVLLLLVVGVVALARKLSSGRQSAGA